MQTNTYRFLQDLCPVLENDSIILNAQDQFTFYKERMAEFITNPLTILLNNEQLYKCFQDIADACLHEKEAVNLFINDFMIVKQKKDSQGFTIDKNSERIVNYIQSKLLILQK